MKALRIIGRVILVLLMIPAVNELLPAVIGIFAAVNQKPEAISYMVGRFVGALLFLMVLVWLFKKLGSTSSSAQ